MPIGAFATASHIAEGFESPFPSGISLIDPRADRLIERTIHYATITLRPARDSSLESMDEIAGRNAISEFLLKFPDEFDRIRRDVFPALERMNAGNKQFMKEVLTDEVSGDFRRYVETAAQIVREGVEIGEERKFLPLEVVPQATNETIFYQMVQPQHPNIQALGQQRIAELLLEFNQA